MQGIGQAIVSGPLEIVGFSFNGVLKIADGLIQLPCLASAFPMLNNAEG